MKSAPVTGGSKFASASALALAVAFAGNGIGTAWAQAPAAGAQRRAGQAAGKARYTKREVEVTGVPQTELTKPKAPQPAEKKQTGPVMTVDEFVGQRQVRRSRG